MDVSTLFKIDWSFMCECVKRYRDKMGDMMKWIQRKSDHSSMEKIESTIWSKTNR